ncbi:MAG: SMI1/KNR4 family protein [Planctomycetia bacterium]|nr:SMI1/KNR4 family protein [Planctomycetia bacterium]
MSRHTLGGGGSAITLRLVECSARKSENMNATLKTISKLLRPPDSPRGLIRGWDVVEQEIGLALPNDYKAFIDLYGTGQVSSAAGWAVIWNFRDSSFWWEGSLSDRLTERYSATDSYRQSNETEWPCPYPIYPEPRGLLPFGSVVDVQNLNWLTVGRANRWDVVYFDFDGSEFTRLEGDSFCRCLLKMLRQEYEGTERLSSLKPPFEFTEIRG